MRIFEINGTLDNNVIMTRDIGGWATHNFCPFIDTKPDVPAPEKYKALGGVTGGLYAFVSDDAVHWKKMQENPVITKGDFDNREIAIC